MENGTRIIREYRGTDKQKIMEIYDAAILSSHKFLEDEMLISERELMNDEIDKDTSKTLVIEEGGCVVGFANFITETALAGFFVAPSCQGNGLGKYLIEHIQSTRKEIDLAVYKRNTRGVRFLRKMVLREFKRSIARVQIKNILR
jgi:putative acetyltransferase